MVFPFTIFFAKASILFLYLRVFYLDRLIRSGVWGGLVVQGLFYSAAVGLGIVSLVQCTGPEVRTNHFCKRYGNEIQILILVFNIVSDIYIIILPIRRISNLQLSFRRKVGLFTVFAGGILSVLLARYWRLLLTSTEKDMRDRHSSLDLFYSTLQFARYTMGYCHQRSTLVRVFWKSDR